jgi:type IV pilus assembly protein PilC
MFYPAIVFTVAIVVSAILLIFVVPQFEDVFKNFGAQLPAFTQMIVDMSRFLTHQWFWVVAWIVAIAVGIIMLYKRSPRFAHFCARAVLKLPVIGQILHQSAIARFARTLGVTFAAGVPLVEALESVGKATGSPVTTKPSCAFARMSRSAINCS